MWGFAVRSNRLISQSVQVARRDELGCRHLDGTSDFVNHQISAARFVAGIGFMASNKGRVSPRDHVVYRPTATGGILVDMKTGSCFELNHIGTDVWRRLAAGETVDVIRVALASKYEVSPVVLEADVTRLSEELLRAGLVTRKSET